MSQVGAIIRATRTDIRLTGPQQGTSPGHPATVLFIYTGEVGCRFVSDSDNTLHDQLVINLPDSALGLGQVVRPPMPVIWPTSWNVNDAFAVVGVNTPQLVQTAEQFEGLTLKADVYVQNGVLVNVQYQLSVIAAI